MIPHHHPANPTDRRRARRRTRLRPLLLWLLVLSIAATAAAVAQAPPGPQIVIPLRVVQSYECFMNADSGCRSIDRLQDAVRRGNTFWAPAGVRFWIKSVEYYDLPLMRQKTTQEFAWSQVRDEIRAVFPNVPADAYRPTETKQGRHWMGAAANFYGDPTEALVFLNDGGSSATGPWGGRLVWLHPTNVWYDGLSIAPTTLPHELGHFLGLQHPDDGPGGVYHHPQTGNPYQKCDFWDQVFLPGSPPQFFASPTSPGCNGAGVVRIGAQASVAVDSPTGNLTIALSGSTFGPADWQTRLIAAPTGLAHLPPEQWGYSLSLMGGFSWDPASAQIDGRVPRHLAQSQIEIVHDFLRYEHPIIQDNLDLYLRDDHTLPLGATTAGLSSQRTVLGTAEDDFLWWSNGDRNGEFSFAKEVRNLGPGYRPVAGDFDGDGDDDLYWYRPATGAATAWWANGDGTFDTVHGYQHAAHARLFAGDFDANGMDDLYFYVPGSTSDVIAYGIGNRLFWNHTRNVHATWEPFAADLDGDLDDDIVWFDPLADNAVIWWSDAETQPANTIGTTFTTENDVEVGGRGAAHCHRPVVGNFDGAYGDDVLWYCAGTGAEKIWKSNGTKTPTRLSAFGTMPASVDGFYRPFGGDFDGDGFDDVFWDDSSPSADVIWAGAADAPEVPHVQRTDIHGFFKAIAGDFDGDGDTDVFWYRDAAERWVESFGYSASAGSWRVDTHPRVMADVNGDGKDDVVGFGNHGVHVSVSTGDGFAPAAQWSPSFGADGWDTTRHPRLTGDVDGDGRDDVVGFGNSAVWVARSAGTSFLPLSNWVNGYGYSNGWRVDKHPRVLADVNGDGRQDVVGFANPGVYVSLSTGSSFTTPQLWVSQFGYNSGWRTDRHPRHLADVDGDGRADVVGFGNGGVWVALSTGSSFGTPQLWVGAYGYSAGNWRFPQHPRFVTDVDGDGRADIVGLDPVFDRELLVSLSTGSSYTAPAVWVDLGPDLDYSNPSETLVMSDVNGDGRADAVAFGGYDDTLFALSTGSSFTRARPWIDQFGFGRGWKVADHPRTLADVDGDGRADLVGFGGSGVYVWQADFCFAGDEY